MYLGIGANAYFQHIALLGFTTNHFLHRLVDRSLNSFSVKFFSKA